MSYLKSIFLRKKVPFYISLGCALIVLISSLMYTIYFYSPERANMKGYISWLVPFVPVMGVLIFIGLTFLKQSRIGAAFMAAGAFTGLVIFAVTVYGFVVVNVMNTMPELPMMIVCAAMQLVAFIVSNVTAWMKHE